MSFVKKFSKEKEKDYSTTMSELPSLQELKDALASNDHKKFSELVKRIYFPDRKLKYEEFMSFTEPLNTEQKVQLYRQEKWYDYVEDNKPELHKYIMNNVDKLETDIYNDKLVKNKLKDLSRFIPTNIKNELKEEYNVQRMEARLQRPTVPTSMVKEGDDLLLDMANRQPVRYTADGKFEAFKDDEWKPIDRLKEGDNCYGTGSPKELCDDFVKKCVLADKDNMQTCIDLISFWSDAQIRQAFDSAFKSNPTNAINILRNFGWQKYQDDDTKLWMAQSVEQWMADNGHTKQTGGAYQLNSNTIKYLTLIVDYINSNPGLLNPDYHGDQSTYTAKPSWLNEAGVPQIITEKVHSKAAQLVGYLRNNAAFSFPSINMLTMSLFSPMRAQFGGAASDYLRAVQMRKEVSGAALIEGLIRSLLDEAEAQGIKIDQTSKDKIQKQIDLHKRVEEYLIKVIKSLEDLIQKRTSMSFASGEFDKIAQRYKKVVSYHSRSQLSLAEIFQKILDILQKDSGSTGTKIPL